MDNTQLQIIGIWLDIIVYHLTIDTPFPNFVSCLHRGPLFDLTRTRAYYSVFCKTYVRTSTYVQYIAVEKWKELFAPYKYVPLATSCTTLLIIKLGESRHNAVLKLNKLEFKFIYF